MAKFKFFGISEADAEIKSADAAINPLLTSAKITTIEVNGKQVPATSDEVPLALKISNLAATFKEGAGDKEISEMTRNNTILADQAKAAEARAVTAETNAATVARENVALNEQVVTLTASVARLTAENAEVITLRKAANSEAGRVTAESLAINSEISKKALAWNAVSDLRDEKGNVLSSKATEAEKLSAAERIPIAEKLTAIGGAVTAALQRAGVRADATPAQPTAGTTGSKAKLSHAEFHALDAKAQTAFISTPHEFTD
jgi:hypothetical protein